MPIPSGVVSRTAAIVQAGALSAVFFTCLVLLASDVFGIVAVLITIPAAVLTMQVYART
jgi:4-hydroxybenzoate polyprenyltransferase